MYLKIYGKTTSDVIEINTLSFRKEDGTLVTIDREQTSYSVEDGSFSMRWDRVYFWGDEAKDPPVYLTDDDADFLGSIDPADIIVNYEDDSDPAAEVTIEKMSVFILATNIQFVNPEGRDDEVQFDTMDEADLKDLWWDFCVENGMIRSLEQGYADWASGEMA